MGKGLGKDQRLRVPTRDVEAREPRVGAQILSSPRAGSADSAGRVEPRSPHAVPFTKSAGAASRRLHEPYRLVTGNEGKRGRREFASGKVEIGPADPTSPDSKPDLARPRVRGREVDESGAVLLEATGRLQLHGPHAAPPPRGDQCSLAHGRNSNQYA